jgi:hypothetical protein
MTSKRRLILRYAIVVGGGIGLMLWWIPGRDCSLAVLMFSLCMFFLGAEAAVNWGRITAAAAARCPGQR